MSRSALRTLHAASSTLGLALISAFFAATIVVEAGGDPHSILLVKTYVLYGLFALAPLMVVAGMSGQRLAGKSQARVIRAKARRMRLVGLNAACVLIPCVVALYWLANHGRLGGAFAAVQLVELVAGAANIVFLGLNLGDGLALKAERKRAGRQRRVGTRIQSDDHSLSQA